VHAMGREQRAMKWRHWYFLELQRSSRLCVDQIDVHMVCLDVSTPNAV